MCWHTLSLTHNECCSSSGEFGIFVNLSKEFVFFQAEVRGFQHDGSLHLQARSQKYGKVYI